MSTTNTNITPIENVHIAILGPISAGKSTLLNALSCDTMSEMKRKRTTMTPQIYNIVYDPKIITPSEEIARLNKEANDRILFLRERGEYNHANMIEACNYNISPLPDFIDLPDKKATYSILDMPGLNDQGSAIFTDFIKHHSNKIDVYILVFDINSSLNTTDEVNIINLVIEQVKKNQHGYIHVLINKADDITYADNGTFEFTNEELKELYEQAERTVADLFTKAGIHRYGSKDIMNKSGKKVLPDVKFMYSISPICASQAYVYRTIKYNPEGHIEESAIDPIIINEVGKKELQKLKGIEMKRKFMYGLLQNDGSNIYSDGMRDTGYTLFRNHLADIADRYPYIIGHHIENDVMNYMKSPIKNVYDTLEYLYSQFLRYQLLSNSCTGLTLSNLENIILSEIEKVNAYIKAGVKTYIGDTVEKCDKNISLFGKFCNYIKEIFGIGKGDNIKSTIEDIKEQRLLLLNNELRNKPFNISIFTELFDTGKLDYTAFETSINNLTSQFKFSDVLVPVARITRNDMRYLTTIMTHHWKFFSFTNPMFNQASVFKCDRTQFKDIETYIKYMYLINIKSPITSPKFNTSKFEEFDDLCQHLMILDDVIINILNSDYDIEDVVETVESTESTVEDMLATAKANSQAVEDMIATAKANSSNRTKELLDNGSQKKTVARKAPSAKN